MLIHFKFYSQMNNLKVKNNDWMFDLPLFLIAKDRVRLCCWHFQFPLIFLAIALAINHQL
jgi:hypothetical protein